MKRRVDLLTQATRDFGGGLRRNAELVRADWSMNGQPHYWDCMVIAPTDT